MSARSLDAGGVALVCNREGRILEVLHDNLGCEALLKPGALLTSLVEHESMGLAGRFIDELCSFGTAVGWELSLPIAERSQLLQFLGCCRGATAVVVAGTSEVGIHQAFAQLGHRRAGVKSKPTAPPSPSGRDPSLRDEPEIAALIEELMRTSRELASSLQRRQRQISSRPIAAQHARQRFKKTVAPGFNLEMKQLPGKVLDGRYLLEEMIGSGGSSVVFRATHLGLSRPVAIKIFLPVDQLYSKEALKRFREEGPSASRVTHPNVVAVLDAGTSLDGIAYIAMELLSGYTLGEVLGNRRQISIQRCVQILRPVCLALIEAHDLGIVHRDIKPDNIFLHQSSAGECVKLLDFGIAKAFDGSEQDRDPARHPPSGITGTPNYMPPEQLRGAACDGRSDVYSLAVLLYEMLCGQSPFSRRNESGLGWMHEHLHQAPQPLGERNPDIPKPLADTIQAALAKDSRSRPTAREFLAQLTAAVASVPPETHDKSELAQGSPKEPALQALDLAVPESRKPKTATTQRKAAVSRTQTLGSEHFEPLVRPKSLLP